MKTKAIMKTSTDAVIARKAMMRLRQAAALLEACGATAAVEQTRLALKIAQADAEERKTHAATARLTQRHIAKCMPRDQHSLFRKDGTLRYVSYMKRSNKRPEVVAVVFRVPGLPSLTTSFTLVDRDFDVVYGAAVRALAQHVGVIDNAELVDTMLSTSVSFKTRYRLSRR
jgi:hypothetical protein